jgi:hypothetical protein
MSTASSFAAILRQMSHKRMVPVLPTPALQWTTTGDLESKGICWIFCKKGTRLWE